jgi:peptide/nickel transport system ATP-binding protein/oligopeptide transport system ATP-binding protein
MSILGLIPQPPGKIVRGEAYFNGKDLLKMSKKELRHVRGSEVSMVFQDPMTSLNPVLKVGYQIGEAVKTHHPEKKDDEVKEQAIGL